MRRIDQNKTWREKRSENTDDGRNYQNLREKRKRMDTKERAKQRIYIGSHIDSWNRIKEAEGVT